MSERQKIGLPYGKHIPRFPGYIDLVTNQRIPAEPRADALPTARTSVLFKPPGLETEPQKLSKAKRLNFFATGLEAPPSSNFDYLDVDAALRETNEANKLMQEAHRRTMIYGGGRVSKEEHKKYDDLESRRINVMSFIGGIDAPSQAYSEMATRQVLRLGAASLHHNLVTRILDFNHGRNDHVADDLFALFDWAHSGIALVNIGGITPAEFIDGKGDTKARLVDAFRFLVEGELIHEEKKHDAALAEIKGEIFQRYPNKTKNMIHLATASVTYIVDISPEALDEAITPAMRRDRTVSDVVTWTKKFLQKAAEVGKTTNQVLTNPDSPEFKALSQEIQGYMAQGRFAELRALNILGVKDADRAKDLYRNARALAVQHPEHTAFYNDLADAIRDFQIEMPEAFALLTADDTPTLLDEEQVDNDHIVGVEDIGKAVDQIHPSAYKQMLTVDPEQIDWGVLVKPASITVAFDKTRYKSFVVKMLYQSQEGESAIVEGKYQTQKGNQTFELNFLEDASEIPQMYQAAKSGTKAVLEDVKRQVDTQRARGIVPVVVLPIEPKPLMEVTPERQTIPEPKSKVKTRPSQPVEPQVKEVAEETVIEPEKSQLRIDEVSQRRLDKQLERLSPEDRENVLETIERFNNGDSVRFYPLKLRGPNDEVLFSLRAKATVRGGSRILATPIKGTSDFALLAAGYRKDIYRDYGIE